jgi:hypothetical protein
MSLGGLKRDLNKVDKGLDSMQADLSEANTHFEAASVRNIGAVLDPLTQQTLSEYEDENARRAPQYRIEEASFRAGQLQSALQRNMIPQDSDFSALINNTAVWRTAVQNCLKSMM